MIGQLRGRVISKILDKVIVDVQGVGYEVTVPLSLVDKLPKEGGEVELKVYTHVREDQLHLFGFTTQAQKSLFQVLLSVSGIGPKMAQTIISEISPKELTQLILTQNINRLTSISGIGKKTAERLVLELKEKMQKLSTILHTTDMPSQEADAYLDLVSALSNLGYKQAQIDRALGQLKTRENKGMTFENLLKQSLQILRS